MRAVVSGATGLLGGHLVSALLAEGASVRALQRGKGRPLVHDARVQWVQLDLGDASSVARALRDVDVVFHCAAAVRPTQLRSASAVNVEGTAAVVRALAGSGARLVHCSSAATLALSPVGRIAVETDAYVHAPAGSYLATKRAAEELVLAAAAGGLDAVVVSPGYLIGGPAPRLTSSEIVRVVQRGEPVPWLHRADNFVAASDVARGMIAAAQRGVRGERYLLGDENLRYEQIVERIARIAGVAVRLEVPERIAAEGLSVCFDSSKAARALGYKGGRLDEGIQRALQGVS